MNAGKVIAGVILVVVVTCVAYYALGGLWKFLNEVFIAPFRDQTFNSYEHTFMLVNQAFTMLMIILVILVIALLLALILSL